MQHPRSSCLRQIIGNSWKLLLTVVLNVAGLLDATLKDIDKFRFFKAIKYSIRHLHVQTHQKNLTRNVLNIFKVNDKLTSTRSVASIVNFEYISHFILLLLLLN